MSISVKIQLPAKAPIKVATREVEVESFEIVSGGTLRFVRSEDRVVEYLPRGSWLSAEHAEPPRSDGTSNTAYSFP